jgi:hypothetical protein
MSGRQVRMYKKDQSPNYSLTCTLLTLEPVYLPPTRHSSVYMYYCIYWMVVYCTVYTHISIDNWEPWPILFFFLSSSFLYLFIYFFFSSVFIVFLFSLSYLSLFLTPLPLFFCFNSMFVYVCSRLATRKQSLCWLAEKLVSVIRN